jgi:transposase
MTIGIARMELDSTGLRMAAARSKDAAASRRMLALALVLEGHSRTEAARAAGMDRQTLRDWVHRYNEGGLGGLKNQANPGRPPRKLTAAQEAEVAQWVREGPKLEDHKVVRWRCKDLWDEIARRFDVKLHERTVGKLLTRLNFSRVSVRPRHPEQDIAAQEAHKKLRRAGRSGHPRARAGQAGRAVVARVHWTVFRRRLASTGRQAQASRQCQSSAPASLLPGAEPG